jgi:hypothetical protein
MRERRLRTLNVPKPADLDVLVIRHRVLDRVQQTVHDQGTVLLRNARADRLSHLLDEVGFGHGSSLPEVKLGRDRPIGPALT